MNHSAPHKALRIFGIVLVILLPVLLALWFAQIRAKAETADQLRLFSRLALQKTEMVIREADEARDKARLYQGAICSPQHQQYLLGIVRGLLYIDDLIYANGTHFFCSTSVRRQTGWQIPAATYTKKPDVAILLLPRDPFLPWLCDELYAARQLCGGG
ncbi:cyclic diguanylate phosphodiesterase (EAL) domain-containing protein [Klebsiella michiganensis]|nr:cyclic diguanylate phosphodiesterase (EAL) domain-containing protein [Klebsiella michiganensis]